MCVGLFSAVTAGREKDESVSFQDRVRRLGVVFGLSPADIEGEAKRTWKHGVTESLYKVAAQKSVGLEYHKTMAECPLYNEAAAGQEDKCEKCKHARILLDWPGRLMREYTNPKNGRTAYEAKYIPFIAPSKLSVVASQMLVKHFKVVLPSVWAECKGLDPDAQPPADTNNTSIPVDVEAATNGVEGDVYDSFCRPRVAVVHGGQSSQGAAAATDPAGTPPVGDRLETILEMLSNAPPVSNDGLPGGGGGDGRIPDGTSSQGLQGGAAAATGPAGTPPVGEQLENILEVLSNPPPLGNDGQHDGGEGERRSPSGGEQPEEEDSEEGSAREAGQVLAGILERRRRPARNAKRPFEEDYVFE